MKDIETDLTRQNMLIAVTKIAGAPAANTVSILFTKPANGAAQLDQVVVAHDGFDYVITLDKVGGVEQFTITEELSSSVGLLKIGAGGSVTMPKDQMIDLVKKWAGSSVVDGVLAMIAATGLENDQGLAIINVDGQEVEVVRKGDQITMRVL